MPQRRETRSAVVFYVRSIKRPSLLSVLKGGGTALIYRQRRAFHRLSIHRSPLPFSVDSKSGKGYRNQRGMRLFITKRGCARLSSGIMLGNIQRIKTR
jgi:hypothetical protein